MSCSRLIKHCPYWQEYVNEDYPCAKYPPYTDVSLIGKSIDDDEETKELPFLCI